jgi:hypothetical protein
VLPVRDETVDFLADLLAAERLRRGTRGQTRSLSCHEQAVLVLRWFLDGTRMSQLARDNRIGKSTGYDYLHEGIDALAARAPSLHGALLAAKAAGYGQVSIDGVLIETDRVSTPGPTPGVDLWWSGKHANHGGNVQVITVPDGWPIWTSDVRPGREHDTTALRTHAEILLTERCATPPRCSQVESGLSTPFTSRARRSSVSRLKYSSPMTDACSRSHARLVFRPRRRVDPMINAPCARWLK